MSGREYENEYEDELDRMRAQRKRRGRNQTRGAFSSGQARPERQPANEFDDDFKIEYLEDEPESETKRKRPAAKKTARHKRKKKRRVLLILPLILLLIVAVLFVKRWMKERDGYWNIAIFGVDSRNGNLGAGALADVQMIASINQATGEIRLVSVYRDTYVQIDDEGTFHKINEAYFIGGYEQALDTFERNFDIQVDDYATFNWAAVADAINILGGIDLEITESEFAYINSFITSTVESTGIYSTQLEHAGLNHLDGVQAVAYSRLRLMDTDFTRTERQRRVVSLALEKAKEADLGTLQSVIATVLPEISTSIGAEDILPLAMNVASYYLGETAGFPFAKTTTIVSKMDCVIPMTLESNVILLHQFLFDDETYEPSESVREISQKIGEITGIYEEGTSSGADSDLTAGSGSSSSATSSGSADTPQTAASAETESQVLQEESEPEEESFAEEEEDEDSTEEEEEESPAGEEEGGDPDSPAPEEPLAPEETTLSQEEIYQGPGASLPSQETGNVTQTGPTEASSEEYGPGFNQP